MFNSYPDPVSSFLTAYQALWDTIYAKGRVGLELLGNGEWHISYRGGTAKFFWPVPDYNNSHNISSGFGWRTYNDSFHAGIDIATGNNSSSIEGKNIVAVRGGTVEVPPYQDGGYGNYVIIDHGDGFKTVYGHCKSIAPGISTGKTVKQGDVIAYVGTTGNSTGNHLHFEIRYNDSKRNPLPTYANNDNRDSNPNPVYVLKNGKYEYNTSFITNYNGIDNKWWINSSTYKK